MDNSFYSMVPKGFRENLQYRIDLRKRANVDLEFRRAVISACTEDVLFFFNAFCWLYEPRPRKGADGVDLPPIIPFITWPHQDPVIRTIKENLGFEDVGLEKSRGEGASWIAALLAEHAWLFEPMSAIGLVSRHVAAVDNPEDPDSLFWKIDWELTKLPIWMAGERNTDWKRNLSEHTLRNFRNGATITGYAATADVASGGRKGWILMDELSKFPRGPDKDAMASTQHVTDSRLVVSTPKGAEGAYYELMHEPSSMVKLVLDWKENPYRNRGLYRLESGVPVAIDPANPLAENYSPLSNDILNLFSHLRRKGFRLEKTIRSPWYDHECDRPGATPQNIAQELDRDYGGSMYRIFGVEFRDKAEKTVREPILKGDLDVHPDKFVYDFNRDQEGPLSLWCALDSYGRPPDHPYFGGADISAGLGGSYSSNSVFTIFDAYTREQVFEYVTNTMQPADFADLCIAACQWFHGAYLAWEINGPGAGFTTRVIFRKYQNVYYRTILWKRGKRRKTKELGWNTDPRSKEAMFMELNRSVKQEDVILRSKELVREGGQYVREGGKIVHVLAGTEDESSKGLSHGDRVIAACVARQAMIDRPIALTPGSQHVPNVIPRGCMAERERIYQESLRKGDDQWNTGTLWSFSKGAS